LPVAGWNPEELLAYDCTTSAVATAAGLAIASFLSAGYGMVQASQCRKAKEELRAAVGGQEPWKVDPEACSLLYVRAGAEVHAGPDPLTRAMVTLREETPVCAANETVGFGMRRVELPDATAGFVKESVLVYR